jgi:alpha-tubulin suppressor-like RCC1 family protein
MIRTLSLLFVLASAFGAVAACSGSGFDGGFPAQNSATEDEDAASPSGVDASVTPGKDGGPSAANCKGTRVDCNKLASDGCEVDTASSPKNCGACGHACASGQVCAKGACVATCPSPLVDCGGACVDTTISIDHCGGCGKPCTAGPNATPLCESSSCTSQCNAGYEACSTGCCEKISPPPPPLQPGASIASGANHSCAITSAGGLKCWGGNTNGKLGDGTAVDRKAPVKVTGLSSGVKAVGTGNNHTCAMLSTGEVRCFGSNNEGQLGNGNNTASKTAVTVSGLSSSAIALAVGRDHACVIVTGGDVKCWGANDGGQLGDGTHGSADTPLTVASIGRPAVALAAGSSHTCALLDDASVVCWGANDSGQLGDGTNDDRSAPTTVDGLPSGVTALSAGLAHTCALAGGKVYCWGANDLGQLGDGTDTGSTSPVAVDGLDSAAQLDTGASHTCVVDSGGMVSCWGAGASGQLGDGINASSTTLVQVDSLSAITIVEVAGGGTHTCARTQGANVKCWGANTRGQLGNGTLISSPVPVAVSGF